MEGVKKGERSNGTINLFWFISIFGCVNNKERSLRCISPSVESSKSDSQFETKIIMLWAETAACKKKSFSFRLFELKLNVAIIITNSKRYFRHKYRDARPLINIETNSQLKHFDVSTFLFFFETGAAFQLIHLF